MNIPTLNQQLQETYQIYLNSIYSQFWENNVSAPLLMDVFDDYEKMENKVLFVGQETHSWGQMNLEPTLQELQTNYSNFNLGKSADYKDNKPLRYLKSPFWNFSRSFFIISIGKMQMYQEKPMDFFGQTFQNLIVTARHQIINCKKEMQRVLNY
ncbi:hypothetical protein [Dyadobacter sp. NIV53]|uniref:hypothetical protein n=1 Tax=Dyadobacter sp. NIV53 TaxID=2861765 RepID=UPI001C86EEA0|nr:hypothetical protein [Dyadobacter sp. NIV53]